MSMAPGMPNEPASNFSAQVIDDDGCKAGDTCCVPLDNGTCVAVKLPSDYVSKEETVDEDSTMHWVRILLAEYMGTLTLVLVVVGSGIMGQTLSQDEGVVLIINSLATVGGLYNLISILGPVSGCHINPIVSMVDVLDGSMDVSKFGAYTVCQILGGICGAVMANILFDYSWDMSTKNRFGYHLWISEVFSTAMLIVVIHGNLRTNQAHNIPSAVSQLVGAGYFFTSSTIFANPAVTLGRMFSQSFAGIQPRSAGMFIIFQIIGAVVGYGVVNLWYPKPVNKPSEAPRKQVATIEAEAGDSALKA